VEGPTVLQKLDYLGLPFRCLRCRRTGHLKDNCLGLSDEEDSESSCLWKVPRCESPVVDSIARGLSLVRGAGLATTTGVRLTHR
jgi:hypothetical protein